MKSSYIICHQDFQTRFVNSLLHMNYVHFQMMLVAIFVHLHDRKVSIKISPKFSVSQKMELQI